VGTSSDCERRPEAERALQEVEEERQRKDAYNAISRYYTQLKYDKGGPEDREDHWACPRCKDKVSPLEGYWCRCAEEDLYSIEDDWSAWDQTYIDVYPEDEDYYNE